MLISVVVDIGRLVGAVDVVVDVVVVAGGVDVDDMNEKTIYNMISWLVCCWRW